MQLVNRSIDPKFVELTADVVRITFLNGIKKQKNRVMFCRVYGFRVRVWESYRTSRSFGYGYESVTELPEVPSIVARAYRTHRSSGRVRKVLYPYPGYCGTGCTELTEVPDTGINVYVTNRSSGTGMKVLQNFQKFRVLWYGRT